MTAADRLDPYDAARKALDRAAELCADFPASLASLVNEEEYRETLRKEESLRAAIREAVDQLEAASSWIWQAENL